jgi:hypothetical protein
LDRKQGDERVLRKSYLAEFKSKVALETIRGEREKMIAIWSFKPFFRWTIGTLLE